MIIKFRAWDAKNKKMFYPKDFFNAELWFEQMEDGSLALCEIDDSFEQVYLVLQQWTGLVDVNKKEIFEGDIVKFKYDFAEHEIEEDVGEVYFEDGMFLFSRELEFATNDCNFRTESLEIVGNVFENPELIKNAN